MFKGLGQLGDIAGIMKQAQEMQNKIGEVQEAIERLEVEGQAGGGLVRVRANGKGKIIHLHIDDGLFSAENKVAVEDLILAAVNDAQAQAAEKSNEMMAEVTGGMSLPDGFKGMF